MTLTTTSQTTQQLGHRNVPIGPNDTYNSTKPILEEELSCVREALPGKVVGISSLINGIHSDEGQRYLHLIVSGQNIGEEEFPDLTSKLEKLGYRPIETYCPINLEGLRLL